VDRDGDVKVPYSSAVPPVSNAIANQITLQPYLTTSPRCTRTSFFDKEEFEGTKNLKCPQADCNYAWCKDCQQEIAPNGPEHSCDGSSEMKHLVQERGWKHCPSRFIPLSLSWSMIRDDTYTVCGTPCEKISGCNHVSVSGM
jgi:hypothetical protein